MFEHIHDLEAWPQFTWRIDVRADRLAAVRYRQGRLLGRMKGMGFNLRADAMLETLTEHVIKSSEIEGDIL